MRLKLKKRGQALVEFALFAVLLMMMISAVIDLGLVFFAYQGLSGAALEGVSYLAVEPSQPNSEAQLRVHYEAGADTTLRNRARFVDLMDLNNDGQKDDATVRNNFIVVETLRNLNTPPSAVCITTNRQRDICDVKITVKYNFRAKFFLATIFGLGSIELKATRQMTITQ